MNLCALLNANSLHIPLADASVQCVVTSPPYYGLRDYGTAQWEGGAEKCDHEAAKVNKDKVGGFQGERIRNNLYGEGEKYASYKMVCPDCGAVRIDNQIGLEETPEQYIEKLVAVMREVRRVLKDDGVLWLNLGDSYAGSGGAGGDYNAGGLRDGQPRYEGTGKQMRTKDATSTISGGAINYRVNGKRVGATASGNGIKPKDLIGIPWAVAFALRADGWYLRSDVIWCLSGGAYVYAKTQKGVLPVMIRDLTRLDPATVQLWNGEKWTQLLGMSKSKRRGDELEIVLRSGERVSCTPTHKFPTKRGLVEAGNLEISDVIQTCQLPDVENPRDCAIDTDAAWLAGLYIAEGSHSDDCIQIAGHSKESNRWERVCKIAEKYGGSCTRTTQGNQMNIRIHGKVLNALIDELVTGHTAHNKGFSPSVWKYSNQFILSMLEGYLSGDGHYDAKNNRWRLGFTRNYNLERDLRTACARLGYKLTLNPSSVKYDGKNVPTFRGEIRTGRSGHHNEKEMGEVLEIRKARCREVYDLGVADEPHLFALASGVLTHNSKPNPMPESVTDRPTKAHEYLFLLSKSEQYFYDAEAVKEPLSDPLRRHFDRGTKTDAMRNDAGEMRDGTVYTSRNRRSVWTVPTQPYSGAHFATYPPALIEPCILAGTSARGECPKCGKAWQRVVERHSREYQENETGANNGDNNKEPYAKNNPHRERLRKHKNMEIVGRQPHSMHRHRVETGNDDYWKTDLVSTGWRPACACVDENNEPFDPVPQVVLDPFAGSGTTSLVARKHGRYSVGLDLSLNYIQTCAVPRLQLSTEEFYNGKKAEGTLDDLPLFQNSI